MSITHPLSLVVLAASGFAAFAGWPAQAAGQQPNRPASKKAAPQATPSRQASRPLAAKDVWGSDYALARQQAKATNRPVLLHFHASWCGPCQQMEQTVLNTSDVLTEINARCVAIKVDSDRQPELVQQFGVAALPCDVLVSPGGKVLMINQGTLSVDEYKALIANAPRTKAGAPTPVKVAGN